MPAKQKSASTRTDHLDTLPTGNCRWLKMNSLSDKPVFLSRKSKQNQAPRASTIASDLRATRRAGVRTAILVTALVSGVVPAFFMLFSPSDNAIPFTQHLWEMWSVALLTYPLTLVVATLTILRKRGLLGFGNLLLTVSIVIFCGSVGNAIGVFGGHETAQKQPAFMPGQPNAFTAQTVAYSNIGYEQNSNSQWQPRLIPSQFGAMSQPAQQYAQDQTSATLAAEMESDNRRPLLGLPKQCLAFFSGYYKTYGYRTFLASVLVGMFAGNTANRFLDHVPR